ncbi:MAG: hypothetical protein CVV13_13320, partial [Gammaproteobacteria bacterium HGW-Gammaproteobacteria-3]
MQTFPSTKPARCPLPLTVLSVAALTLTPAHSVKAGFDESVENLLKFGQSDARYGRITFDLNYRYEHADTENTA